MHNFGTGAQWHNQILPASKHFFFRKSPLRISCPSPEESLPGLSLFVESSSFFTKIRVEPAQPDFFQRDTCAPTSLSRIFFHVWVEPAQPTFWTFGFSLDRKCLILFNQFSPRFRHGTASSVKSENWLVVLTPWLDLAECIDYLFEPYACSSSLKRREGTSGW